MDALNEERQFFKEHQSEWEKLHPGKVVLIKGKEFAGVFDNVETAIAEGVKQFGNDSFLVRSVSEKEEPIYIPALTLGLLYANTECST